MRHLKARTKLNMTASHRKERIPRATAAATSQDRPRSARMYPRRYPGFTTSCSNMDSRGPYDAVTEMVGGEQYKGWP